jgi:hypothetical protein
VESVVLSRRLVAVVDDVREFAARGASVASLRRSAEASCARAGRRVCIRSRENNGTKRRRRALKLLVVADLKLFYFHFRNNALDSTGPISKQWALRPSPRRVDVARRRAALDNAVVPQR